MTDENKPIGNSDWLEEFGLRLKEKVSCDGLKDGTPCADSATHYFKVSCCGSVFLVCGACMYATARTAKMAIQMNRLVLCKFCGEYASPNNWMDRPRPLALDSNS